jgi:predicted phage terminase large subunit-like protein
VRSSSNGTNIVYVYILIEDKASGTQLIQDLKLEGVIGIHPFEPLPRNDKILRAYEQAASFEAGIVYSPTTAPWLDEYRRELTTFPGSKYDDQVDSTTQALEVLSGKQASLLTWARLGFV